MRTPKSKSSNNWGWFSLKLASRGIEIASNNRVMRITEVRITERFYLFSNFPWSEKIFFFSLEYSCQIRNLLSQQKNVLLATNAAEIKALKCLSSLLWKWLLPNRLHHYPNSFLKINEKISWEKLVLVRLNHLIKSKSVLECLEEIKKDTIFVSINPYKHVQTQIFEHHLNFTMNMILQNFKEYISKFT